MISFRLGIFAVAVRLGDEIDDFCVKCKRVTNHNIVALVRNEPAKVRCRSCYHDHEYLREQSPPSRKELRAKAQTSGL